MAIRLVTIEPDPEADAADWLAATDDRLLACRAQGHAFPKLRAGRVPRGIRATRQHDGAYQVTSTCRDCGTERTLTTLPGGALDLPASYTYRWPRGYATPAGAHITRRMALAELWDRAIERVAESAS